MLTMIPGKIKVFGFTKGRDKYTDAQVAALIEELDLVPAPLITPCLVKQYREEVREACETARATKETVRMAIERCEVYLASEVGKAHTAWFEDLFSFVTPNNR